jgi:hypothetical protein
MDMGMRTMRTKRRGRGEGEGHDGRHGMGERRTRQERWDRRKDDEMEGMGQEKGG